MNARPSVVRILFGAAVVALVAPSASRAEEATQVRLWCPNPLIAVFKEAHYADQVNTPGEIRLVAPANGVASGQAVLCSKEPFRITGAAASTLKRLKEEEGEDEAVIAATAVEVRYALPTGADRYAAQRLPGVSNPSRFDALSPVPGEPGTVQPVWVTVSVPADARPGDYDGRLSVQLEKVPPVVVPVRLTVANWTIQKPEAFRSHVGFIQSPDSLAIRYQTPLWSKEHYALIARSFHYLGLLGNKTLYLPLLAQVHFGNEEGMVRWIRNEDGSFSHDFSVLEAYTDLYLKHVGVPDVVCLYVWDYSIGGAWWGQADKRQTPQPVPVTRLDPRTGRTELMHGPVHGAPDSEAFWRPVMDGVRDRLNRRGIADEHILVGIAGDKRPDKDTAELFAQVAPYARWVCHSHGRVRDIQGVPVGYFTLVWGVGAVSPPEKKRVYGWQQAIPATVFPRYGGGQFVIHPNLSFNAPLAVYRHIFEGATVVGLRGVGRVGADFWPVLDGPRGQKSTILNRYPAASWGQLTVTNAVAEVLAPGPEGPIATVRFEMLREGLQEAEARIFIERALTSPDLRARIGDELAARCQDLLDERVRTYLQAHGDLKQAPDTTQRFAESDWPARTRALFDAAGEVARALTRE